MKYNCIVCNLKAVVTAKTGVELFTDNFQTDLKSGKKLSDVLGEILKKQITPENTHTQVLCKKCHKAIVEYDCLQVRCQAITLDLMGKFKKSLPKHRLQYESYNSSPYSPTIVKSPPKKDGVNIGKLVLPASKLKPLPPDFVIRPGNLQNLPKLKPISTLVANPQTSVGQVVVPNITITTKLLSKAEEQLTTKTSESNCSTLKNLIPANTTKSILVNPTKSVLSNPTKASSNSTTSVSDSVFTINVASLPKDFMSSAVLRKISRNEYSVIKKEDSDNSDCEINEENPMEIDEDGNLAVMADENQLSTNKFVFDEFQQDGADKTDEKQDLATVKLMPSQGYMLGNLRILQGQKDDEDEHTIVMDGENGSILRMVSGQKLVLGDGQISLVMPEDSLDNGDSQDSNEESQIELQVSGDEETANAIIAAAQEQGGAFIKVESGEMFRVQSVQSKEDTDHSDEDSVALLQMVTQNIEDGQFRCQMCVKNDRTDTVFMGDAMATMAHLKQEHNARVYICSVCGKLVRKRSHYARHLDAHASEKSILLGGLDKGKVYECNICLKKYSSRNLLTEHLNTHSGLKPHACGVCGKRFASKYTHHAHVKTHLDRPRPYKCTHSQCGKSFFTQQNLNQHEKTHSGIKDFVCTVCNKAFGTQHNLEVHGVVHSRKRPFACPCGKAFARRAELRDHMRTHTGERPFSCDVCGARFTQRSNLYSHRRATHMDDKRYHCDLCPKRFKRRRLLDYHVKASHTGERPLKCDVCHATFVYPEHYKKHVRIHSGEKPFVCEICGKSFNSRDNRNTHRFVHSDRKPYECLVCGAGYMRKQLLYHHMNTSGHLAESIVVNQPRVNNAKMDQVILGNQSDSEKMDRLDTVYESAEDSQLEAAEKSIEITGDDNSPTKYFITSDEKLILKDGKSINVSQDCEESGLLSLHTIDGELKSEGAVLEGVTVEQLEQQVVPCDGGLVRLVQIQLPGGSSGWVAINQ